MLNPNPLFCLVTNNVTIYNGNGLPNPKPQNPHKTINEPIYPTIPFTRRMKDDAETDIFPLVHVL